jgi:hypothetical protein
MLETDLEEGIIMSGFHRVCVEPVRAILVAGIACATWSMFTAPATAKAFNSCHSISQAALRSCLPGARSDDWLALGRCDNLPDASARKTCASQARMDGQDAGMTCRSQHSAREAVCARLGAAPYAPTIDPANFVATIDNPFFPLPPGKTFVYEGDTAQGHEHDEFAVTHNTKVILGVTCIEVHDTVHLAGDLTEDTLDWFAQDTDGNVWYFGENSKQLAGGLFLGVEGSWIGGIDGAEPGIVMKAHPAVGDFYRQEYLLGVAEDMAEVVSLTDTATVPFPPGAFSNVLKTLETSPLEPDASENKYYAVGVGNILTVDLVTGDRSELTQILDTP